MGLTSLESLEEYTVVNYRNYKYYRLNHAAGNCRIGEAAYIRMWAVVLDNITIGEHSGASSMVAQDFPVMYRS